MSTTESSQDLVLRFYKAFDDRAIDRALDLLAPNFVAHQAGMPEPLDGEGFKRFGLSFYTAFSQGQHRFDEIVAAGDRVITCGMFTATHLGSFQGLPPTGRQISLAVMHIDRVENGKIVEHWGQGDALGLMQQLGVVFLPGPKLLPHLLRSAVTRWF
ncbi:ester cyclase [Phormidium tenue]|uniref:Ester cyclase n=1 Tax=Phormidium tenue NIES-30 TaxID=549789 RepID=A0A1U7J6Y1_9CYAN|nr:ester cyclase [Phormidium tenue]MBD2232300.1 ester cyclase [Phormidium tenue FACHB-1052]OKH48765.1 ester cyclase [Phormidium tenue NIES-30]